MWYTIFIFPFSNKFCFSLELGGKKPKFSIYLLSFKGCHNEVPQPKRLETTEMYCLIVLEARGLKSSYRGGHALWKLQGSPPFPFPSF